MEWPVKDSKTGKPKTTPTNISIWKAAIQPAASEYPDEVQAWLDAVEARQTNWRNDYLSLLEEFSRIHMKTSPATMTAMCQAGYSAAKEAFVFRMAGSDTTMSLDQAWGNAFDSAEPLLETKTYRGNKPNTECEKRLRLGSPHGSLTHPLYVHGEDAVAQATAWANYGCMEASAAEHAKAMLELADVTSHLSSRVFVLLGVTSEMGPAAHLLRIPGAHVVGVARRGPRLDSLVEYVQKECPASSTLQVTEADMLTQGPEIARWLVDLLQPVAKNNRQIVLMPMAYMDGEANVRVVLSMEQIVAYVKKHITGKTAVAYYPTPTTCYMIPSECAMDAKKRYESPPPLLVTLLKWTSFGSWFKSVDTWNHSIADGPNSPGFLMNGLVHLQGPSYALAKQLQLWQCLVAAASMETIVPVVAPGTRTQSVVSSPEAAAALEGMPHMAPPVVNFDVASSSTLLAAILLRKLELPPKSTRHPLELFWDGAVHGGGWRCPYQVGSVGIASYMYGKLLAKAGSCPAGALAPLLTKQDEEAS
eukprot:scaffold1959_cov162-Amphora_coffeaeformis.AAC.14